MFIMLKNLSSQLVPTTTCRISKTCSYSSYFHVDTRDRPFPKSRYPCSSILESCNWSCRLTQGGSVGLNHRVSPVSLCLKSGDLGFFLFFLLSHHSCGLTKKTCHR
ncbi:hypothetical protein AQUCO_01000296v1 [Aquilegia coerulea]|uniref:Uncharacterized protein n=1 Tax=Aquilegia coerulea TaxID=218851 RepID=A0A2G5E9C4_AQUCA|nr:hypothetical protein AQUCO_01000296v1 [Aquilegia coerulea]